MPDTFEAASPEEFQFFPESLSATNPEDWLQFTFRPDDTGASPNLVVPVMKIFAYSSDDISKGPMSAATVDFQSSDSQASVASKFSARFGIEASYGAFSGAVKASTDVAFSASTKVFRADMTILAQKYNVLSNVFDPTHHLRPGVKEFFLNRPAEDIITTFGAFFPKALALGGVLRSTFIKARTKSDTHAKFSAEVRAKAHYLIASASGSASGSASYGKS